MSIFNKPKKWYFQLFLQDAVAFCIALPMVYLAIPTEKAVPLEFWVFAGIFSYLLSIVKSFYFMHIEYEFKERMGIKWDDYTLDRMML